MLSDESKPMTIRFAPAILAAGAGAVVWVLVRFWGANPEYLDRFLILAASAWIAWLARPELLALEPRPTRVGYVPLLVGAAAFPVGWFLQSQVGPKPVVLWWLAGSWVLAAAGFVLIAGGWSHLRRFAFPLVFVLFALPIPNRILVPLQFALQSATTSAAAAALPALGVSVERNGFVLQLAERRSRRRGGVQRCAVGHGVDCDCRVRRVVARVRLRSRRFYSWCCPFR